MTSGLDVSGRGRNGERGGLCSSGSLRGRQGLHTPPVRDPRPHRPAAPSPAGVRLLRVPARLGEEGCALIYHSYHKRVSRDQFLQTTPPHHRPPPWMFWRLRHMAELKMQLRVRGCRRQWAGSRHGGRASGQAGLGHTLSPGTPAPAGLRLDNARQTPGTMERDPPGAGPAPEPTQRVALLAWGEVTAWGLGTPSAGGKRAATPCSSSQWGACPVPSRLKLALGSA